MSSVTQLQRLSIGYIDLSEEDLKESPSTLFGSIPLSLIEICYYRDDAADMTSLLAFPSLTKLQLYSPD
jgi:hypothetical protein